MWPATATPRRSGPEGYPIDWHGVRAFYRVLVDAPTEVIVEDVGGSTSEACWMALAEVAELPAESLTEVTAEALKAAKLT